MDMQQALSAPGQHFDSPEQLAGHDGLNHEQKCQALYQWAYDLRELQVATDENMGPEMDAGQSADLLQRIEALLARLDPEGSLAVPTRQGG